MAMRNTRGTTLIEADARPGHARRIDSRPAVRIIPGYVGLWFVEDNPVLLNGSYAETEIVVGSTRFCAAPVPK